MLLFQKALQVAVTHIAVLFSLGGFLVSSFLAGNGLKVIDSRPTTNPWVAGGLLLIDYAVPRIFKQFSDRSVVVYPGYSSTYAPVDVLRANQSLALVWNAVGAADLLPVIPSVGALVSASVSSSISSVNAALFSKIEPHKALLDTGRPRCSASGSKSNGLATNGNTLINVTAISSGFAGQISATRPSLSMVWKAGYVADALVVKGATVPNVPSPTVLVAVSTVSSFTTTLDATHFCLNEPNKALVDTGRPHCAASDAKKMEHTTTGTITDKFSGSDDQCYANQLFGLYRKAGYGTCSSPIETATVSSVPSMVVLSLASISSSITSMDAMLFCLNEPNKALLNSGRPRCAASGSKKKGQGANGNNARKGTTRKSSGSGGRSSDSSGSSSSGSSSGGSSGGSAPPPPPPPPPGRSGGVATRRSSRLRNSPRPDYALTTPRARRTLKVKEFEAPPDPPSGPPPPPPPPNEPENHGPYDVGDLYDPFTPWLRKIMIFIFCVYAACNMASKLVRIIPRSLVSEFFSLRHSFLKLQDLVPILMERANNWFQLESAPAPYFAPHRIHVPSTWRSSDGVFNPFPVFTELPSEGLQLRFPSPPDDILEALVQAGLIERSRGPLFGLRKYLSRLIIAIIGVFAAFLMLDIDGLCDMVNRVLKVNKEEIILRAGVARSVKFDSPSTPFWLAPGIEYEPGDSILDESYLATPKASPRVEGKLIEDATNTSDASDDLSTLLRDLVEHKSVSRARDEETASDASFHTVVVEGLNEEEAQIACALVFLAAYLLQQQHAASLEGVELAIDDEDVRIPVPVGDGPALSSFSSQLLVHQERSSNSIADVYDSINDTVSTALKIEKTTHSLQSDAMGLTRPEDTPEAASGSASTVTDLSASAVESERTGDASDEVSNSLNGSTSQLNSSVHDPAHESGTSMATALSELRGIWSPPVTEINGLPFVVVEGARKRRKRNRKPKALANSA